MSTAPPDGGELLRRALFGALAGAAQSTGAVPGAAHKVLATALERFVKVPRMVEFVGAGMHAAETARKGAKATWAAIPETERKVWRQRATDAMVALQALCSTAAKEALEQATNPEHMLKLVQTALDALKAVKKKRG